MRFLVTGAHGFIGSHLTERLLGQGHRVRALVTPWGSLRNLQAVRDHASLELVRADLAHPQSLAGVTSEVDAVVHAAARLGDWGDDRRYWPTNVEGTSALLEDAGRSGVARFVLVSSIAVHSYSGFMDADASELPRDNTGLAYARSKIAAEDLVLAWPGEGVIVRPGLWPFGPRDPQLPRVARALRSGVLPLVGGGRSRFNPAYVENLAYGLELAAVAPLRGRRTFVIGDSEAVSWLEFLSELALLLGARPPSLSLPANGLVPLAGLVERLWKVARPSSEPPLTRYRALLMRRDVHFSMLPAWEHLGYRPLVDWREGLRRTVERDAGLAGAPAVTDRSRMT